MDPIHVYLRATHLAVVYGDCWTFGIKIIISRKKTLAFF